MKNERFAEVLWQSVATNIRTARREQEMSQQDLADLVGISRTSIVNIEKERQHPPLDLLFEIAFALDTDLTEIIGQHWL